MAIERTLSIIKPDGVEKGYVGRIISRFETSGLKPGAMRMVHLSQKEAEGFYAVHRQRPFFRDLVAYMTSGPVVLMVLEGENAIARNREVMGATDPAKAAPGTIRADFAKTVDENAVHGSDGPETARAGSRIPHRVSCLNSVRITPDPYSTRAPRALFQTRHVGMNQGDVFEGRSGRQKKGK